MLEYIKGCVISMVDLYDLNKDEKLLVIEQLLKNRFNDFVTFKNGNVVLFNEVIISFKDLMELHNSLNSSMVNECNVSIKDPMSEFSKYMESYFNLKDIRNVKDCLYEIVVDENIIVVDFLGYYKEFVELKGNSHYIEDSFSVTEIIAEYIVFSPLSENLIKLLSYNISNII